MKGRHVQIVFKRGKGSGYFGAFVQRLKQNEKDVHCLTAFGRKMISVSMWARSAVWEGKNTVTKRRRTRGTNFLNLRYPFSYVVQGRCE